MIGIHSLIISVADDTDQRLEREHKKKPVTISERNDSKAPYMYSTPRAYRENTNFMWPSNKRGTSAGPSEIFLFGQLVGAEEEFWLGFIVGSIVGSIMGSIVVFIVGSLLASQLFSLLASPLVPRWTTSRLRGRIIGILIIVLFL